MHKVPILIAVALQCLYLASLAAQREHLIRTGDSIFMRTAPVDPRDLFRGDYVTLRYGVNGVSSDALRGDVAEHLKDSRYPVYASLEPSPGSKDLYQLRHLSDVAPQDGPYLSGRIAHGWRFSAPPGGAAAEYGIEALFVEQGQGLEIEKKRGYREGLQIPMEVELAVGRRGDAAIRGFRWSPIGIQFEVLRLEQRSLMQLRELGDESLETVRSPEVSITLQNVSEQTWWLVDPGDHCSFKLVGSGAGSEPWTLAHPICEAIEPTVDDYLELLPGESYTVNLDLDLARWQVLNDGQATSLAGLGEPTRARFRIAYSPETKWAEAAPTSGDQLWLIEMPSPNFSAIGRVD